MKSPTARILAVEPDPENATLCRENTGLYPNVELLQAAIWHVGGRLDIRNSHGRPDAFTVQESLDSGDVDAVTMVQLVEQLGGTCDVVKMDIEGAELSVLRESSGWVPKVSVLIVELHDRFVPGCSDSLRKALAGLRHRATAQGENTVVRIDG